jgi:phage-related protein
MDLGGFEAKVAAAREILKGLKQDITDTISIRYDGSALKAIAADAERLSGLSDKNLRIKLDMVDGSRTWTELVAIEREMDALNGKTAHLKVDVDQGSMSLLSRLLGGGGGLRGLLAGFPAIGALPAGAGGVGAIGAIAAAAAAALPVIAMLASGFVAAGAGAVAFGAMAKPAIANVQTAYTQLKTAQDAYAKAAYVESIDPTKAHATALKNAGDALKYYQQQVHALGPAGASAVQAIQNLISKGGQLQTAFQPTATKVFGAGLKAIYDLLPAALPMAQQFGNALAGLLTQFDKFANSASFKSWLSSFTKLIGPSATAIGQGIGQVAIQVGKLMTIFSGKDVASAIHTTFNIITGALIGLRYLINGIRSGWDQLSASMKSEGKAIGIDLHAVASAFDSVRHGFAGIGHDIAADFDQARRAVAVAAHDIAHAFDTVRGEIASKFASAATWLVRAGTDIVHGLESGAKAAWGAVASWFGSIGGHIKGFFSAAGSWLVAAGKAILQGLLSGLESMAGTVLGWVENFAKSVMSKFASILHLHSPSRVFYGYGVNIAEGLAQGMAAGAGRVQAAAGMLAAVASGGGGYAGRDWYTQGAPGVATAGGGVIEVHSHVHLDGREIHASVSRQAVQSQRRTGQTGMVKRTR